MTIKSSASQTALSTTLSRLPSLLTVGILSTGLLLSGCSNNDKVDNETAVNNNEDTTAISKTSNDTVTDEAKSVGMDNMSEDAQVTDSTQDKTIITSDNINPVTADSKQKSLVTNPTQNGTPEDTVKKALDSLYYGDAKQAATYYKVDMANFEEELAKTQSAFQQTVDGVTFTDTKYNDDKTRATIMGEIMLRGQSEPAPLTYELQKTGGKWKILG
ncbi:hypothetical protein [Psychrobacter sp.]|uniref:hypothetical protein n=1 Tax=Psychrobacter sp. TaxID=56811 RepID=UPI002FD961BD